MVLITLAALTASTPSPSFAERCGTWRHVGAEALASPAAMAARPGPGAYQAGSPHFIVHYGDTLLSDYAQDVSEAAELAWRVLVDTLSYDVPPTDGGAGGDARVDIYIVSSLAGAWGTTFVENLVGAPYVGSSTSWVEMVDTLSYDRRLVVAAHEFFHVVQIGYDAYETPSFYEMISTWCEDRVYDDANLYLEVLPNFFNQPQKGLYTFTYSNVPWSFYLTENYGDGVIRDILEGCGLTQGANVTAATDAALAPHASSQAQAYERFTRWNFFTGGRDDGTHYREGASWPEVAMERRTECLPFYDYITVHKMNRLGANYYFFLGDAATDAVRLRLVPSYYATGAMTVNRFQQGAVTTETFDYTPFAPEDSVTVSDWEDCDSLLVIYSVVSSTQNLNTLQLSAYKVAPAAPSDPYVLVLDRDACRQPFDGIGDDFTARDGEQAPVAASLRAAGLRVVQSDSIPPDLSACGGVFVVGGHDGAGTTLSDAEYAALSAFMDGGGDVYVESNQLGRWIDPSRNTGTPTANAFWSAFGCDWLPGNAMATGNVSSWSTWPGSLPDPYSFNYDYRGDSDDLVGRLQPTLADTFAVDQSGTVRTTVNTVGSSTRVMSTLLLGGATGAAGARDAFIAAIVDRFDSIVASLSAANMRVVADGRRVRIEGELLEWTGQRIRLRRVQSGSALDVPLSIVRDGQRVLLRAVDEPAGETVVYRLEAVDEESGEAAWLLWEQTVEVFSPSRPLALTSIRPNPTGGPATLVVESDRPAPAVIRVYNVAGQLVVTQHAGLARGANTLILDDTTRLGSGVYFVRVEARGRAVVRKLHILR